MLIGIIMAALFGLSLIRVIAVAVADRKWDGQGCIFALCFAALLAFWITL